MRMTIFQLWLRNITCRVSSCDTGNSCVRWAEVGTWTTSWDVGTAHTSKLLLGLRGPPYRSGNMHENGI